MKSYDLTMAKETPCFIFGNNLWFVSVFNTATHSVCCFLSPPADYSTSEMLVNMGNLPLDEFYPAVAIVTLMRILRDPSLSNHHTMVVQAVTFIFKSLGLKCVQFLPQVMPTFLNVIRVCDASIREVISSFLLFCQLFTKQVFKTLCFCRPPVSLSADGNGCVLCEDSHPPLYG